MDVVLPFLSPMFIPMLLSRKQIYKCLPYSGEQAIQLIDDEFESINVLRLDTIYFPINNDLHYLCHFFKYRDQYFTQYFTSLLNLQPHAKKFDLSLQSSLLNVRKKMK